MATTHKLLNTEGSAPWQLGVAGTPADIYDPDGVTGLVKTIVLHNMNSSTEVVEVFFNGTADTPRILNVSLEPDETFEWSLGHMIVVESDEVLKGQSTTADKVNYFIFGAEES